MAVSKNKNTPADKSGLTGVRERLTTSGFMSGKILLDGEVIGTIVSYGGGRRVGNVGLKTLYGSRIYKGAVRIEEEASSVRVLLDKVAFALRRALKDGTWPT